MGHRRSPGVQHRRDGDLRTEPLGISGNRQRCLGGYLEQEIIDDGLVLVGDVGDWRRQRVNHVKVRHRQQFCLTFGEPVARRRALALGAMPIAAAVEGDGGVTARRVLAARNMTSERRRAATLDGRHHLQLAEAHMGAIGLTPSGPVVAENIRNLQSWTEHKRRVLLRRLVLLGLLGQLIERAHHLGDQVGGDACVVRRRIQPLVAEQSLNHADIKLAFQQMRRK